MKLIVHLNMRIAYRKELGRQTPYVVFDPDVWQVSHLFEDIVEWHWIDEFIEELDMQPHARTSWFDDEIAVLFDQPDVVGIQDVNFGEDIILVPRATIRALMIEWRSAVIE